MSKLNGSLCGYAYDTHRRDKFKCKYCGLDGTKSFDKWLCLSRDHLLPKGHALRDNPDYIVTACKFCNTVDNQFFIQAKERSLQFDGLTPDELVKQRELFVKKRRAVFREFWKEKV